GELDNIKFLAPTEATTLAFVTIFKGDNTIAVTCNVLRDYLTDLFPIIEVGTSAKMLSVVGLMNGGGMFETGAGGSAPKHVEQLMEENHLRWDSLGEFCAIAEALRFEGTARGNAAAAVLGDAADKAIVKLLDENRSPGRKVGQPDSRDSHYYFALFWAEALESQSENAELASAFAPVAQALRDNAEAIISELHVGRGAAVDLGGYYNVMAEAAAKVMRPSATLNAIIDG
ncbi:MAG: NADP-dependent isocitrate dehydrogenase, partial [Litoreibacter sp.]|nr:NADP-dependent isocitrate dehydrogenase [Litoreibacter sp.]